MKASIDISLYPLDANYSKIITDFILILRQRADIRVDVNGLSTQIFGEYETLLEILKAEMAPILTAHRAVFVLKVTSGERLPENLPEVLQ